MRLFYFIEDFIITVFLAAAILAGVLVLNPPTPAEMTFCQITNGDGFDYSACVIDRAL